MGKNEPLAIVLPADFKKRTALALSSRSGTTLAVDKAYENYYATRSPVAGQLLHDRLGEYMMAHGRSWASCERNRVSGGLMEYLYNLLGPAGAMTPAEALAMDKRAAARIRDVEIPNARFGVLYFLSGLRMDLDLVGSLIDGAGAIGGAVGVGMTTNFGNLGSARNGVTAVAQVFGKGIKANHVAAAGKLAAKGAREALPAAGGAIKSLAYTVLEPTVPTLPSPPSAMWLPITETALMAASAGLSKTWNANKYAGALAYAGAGLAAIPAGAATLLIDGGIALSRAAAELWRQLGAAVDYVADKIRTFLSYRYDLATARKIGVILKRGSVVLVDFIMKNAIPFLGGAVDLGSGLFRAISEAGTRIASWNDRRHIRLQAGHPEELANAIERQMSMGILGGLGDMLKGAAKVAVGVFLPGLGSLVSAVMSGIEWLVRMVSRLGEYLGIEQFLQRARSLYAAEKQRAKRSDRRTELPAGYFDATPDRYGQYEPNTAAGGLITDTKAFTAFFKEGCKVSPLIPMLTLNSGLGGSLMTMLQLFEEDGSQSRRATANVGAGETREFDRGNAYFTRLKRYSVDYMRESGFKFSAINPSDKAMVGYLLHATGMGETRQSHVAAGSRMGQGGALIKA